MHAKHREFGFTLLEVLVATTIVGLVFGGVFSAIVASKQLDFRTKKAFDRSAEMRLLGSTAALYLTLNQTPSPDLLAERYILESQKIIVKYDDEENLQSGQLEQFSISGGGADFSGIVWVSQFR